MSRRRRPIPPPHEATTDAQLASLRARVRADATDRPGTYRMIAADGEILYVGKSKQVRTRLLSYFRCSYPEEKGARILREAQAIDWDYMPSEFAALLDELRLIKRFRPRFNVAMKRDAHHYAFIKITRPPASKLVVLRGSGLGHGTADDGVYYGPFVGALRVAEAVRELSDVLGLRDCALDTKMHFSDQPELFDNPPLPARTPGCIRFEVNKCLGPCVGGCSVSDYTTRVQQARAFLEGAHDGPIDALRQQMADASDRMAYERAAALRDKAQRLVDLREQFGRLRFAVETLSFVYTVPGHDGDDRAYVIRRGCVRAERAVPRTEGEAKDWRDVVRNVFAPVDRAPPPSAVPAHEIDELMLLSSWFRRFPAELDRTEPAST
jgi:excinuclease ABC subunit C